MTVRKPHFLLFSEALTDESSAALPVEEYSPPAESPDPSPTLGKWRFILEAVAGEDRLEVGDDEPHCRGQRLELLAVIRGLEALEQPSRVTLVTPSRYVVHGLRFGLSHWKENDWHWERFGELIPIKNQDLWQRLDAALRIHQVECRSWDARPASDLDLEPQTLPAVSQPARRREQAAAVSHHSATRSSSRRRRLRLDPPQAGPKSSAPPGWWGSILGWMRRAATAG